MSHAQFIHRKSFSIQEWGAAEVNSAVRKAVECNNAESYILAIFGLVGRNLGEVLRKLQDACGKTVVSKVVTLAIPMEEYGNF